jgi:hypothetical protein
MKLNKRWIIAIILLGISLVLLMQVNSVRATFSDMHTAMILLRLETEIMQTTPMGRYYEALFWKHNDELIEITREYPEHQVEFSRVTRMFVPGLEALLDGKGDKFYVTPDQIENLKAEFAWFASVGSLALRRDIERELQRFPLDQFIGMTMIEAQDFINSNWTPESIIEKSMVPASNGKWAYYVYNGVYFEYPSSYSLQISESQENFIYLIPTTGVPENWNPCIVKVRVLNVPPDENDRHSRPWYSPENILWETQVQNIEFPGISFAGIIPDYPVSHIHSFQYNEANQLAVHMTVFVYKTDEKIHPLDYSEMIGQKYGYFQHMVDSLRIQNR